MSLLLAEEVWAARSSCSHNMTDRPRPAASRAMPQPLMPPPTTSRSQDFSVPEILGMDGILPRAPVRSNVRAVKAYMDVRLQRIDVSRAERLVLRDIDWQIRPGQRWALVGANGAGKTQLLKLIAGSVWPVPDGGRSVDTAGVNSCALRRTRRRMRSPMSDLSVRTVMNATAGITRYSRSSAPAYIEPIFL